MNKQIKKAQQLVKFETARCKRNPSCKYLAKARIAAEKALAALQA